MEPDEPVPNISGYDLEAELGRGGMGVVYRARRRSDGRMLALKTILAGGGAAISELVRFRIEAEALGCLDHPGIIKIRDVGMHRGYPFLVMDFAERGSLSHANRAGLQTPSQSARVVRSVALAIQHAHDRGMFHRDLKPANVLLGAEGEPIVTDFGLVKFTAPVRHIQQLGQTMRPRNFSQEAYWRDLETDRTWEECAARTGVLSDRSKLESIRSFVHEASSSGASAYFGHDARTEPGSIMGSPCYMAPEQARGDLEQIDARTDVYAIGGILYELLTNRPPFQAESVSGVLSLVRSTRPTEPRVFVPNLSPAINAICLKCLEKEPGKRYQSAADLAEDLSLFLDGYVPAARNPSLLRRLVGLPPSRSKVTGYTTTPEGAPAATKSWWPFSTNSKPAQ